MEEIIQIRFTDKSLYTDENRSVIVKLYSGIIKFAVDQHIWDDSIKAIIITDDLITEVKNQATLWNINFYISQEKEYSVASKILFNQNLDNPEYHIFIPFQNLCYECLPHQRIALGQIINISSKKLIPKEIWKFELDNSPVSLDDYIMFASTEWITADYTRELLDELIKVPYNPFDHNSFLISFKRKLKKYLFEYNSDRYDNDRRLKIFWVNYFGSIKTLFLRITETFSQERNIQVKEIESCHDLIYKLIAEINLLTKKCINKEGYDIFSLKEAVKRFSAHFEIFLEEEKNEFFRVRLTKDPKDYFVDEIVETEPRFVCFIDILGFTELINEYDSDITSTVLQDIQESFSLAKTYLIDNNVSQFKDTLKHLKYQTFSDNICISIPYFDNETDFLSNFNLLTTYIRGLQVTLMTKGFFTRGGISTGSFYSDNNIIFSKGLVNAYLLESKKANFPRVIIDKTIIDKLFSYNHQSIKYFGLDKVIIFDWENVSFLNPFGLIESSLHQFDSIFEELKTDTDDPMVNTLNSISKRFSNLTIDLLKSVSSAEKQSVELIKIKIA